MSTLIVVTMEGPEGNYEVCGCPEPVSTRLRLPGYPCGAGIGVDDDLHTLQEALAATTAALARFRGLPQPARIREYVADDGVPVVQIDTAPDAAPIRVNLNDTRIHDVATAPQAATPNTADYWPTEAGLVALNATAGDYGRH